MSTPVGGLRWQDPVLLQVPGDTLSPAVKAPVTLAGPKSLQGGHRVPPPRGPSPAPS